MSPQNTRVAFMGTPELATPVLKALIDAGYNVVAVDSQPPRPKAAGINLQKAQSTNWLKSITFRFELPHRLNQKRIKLNLKRSIWIWLLSPLMGFAQSHFGCAQKTRDA